MRAAESVRSVGIAAPDYLDTRCLPALIARVGRLAPHARLSIRPLTADMDYERLLEEGEVDVVIANWPNATSYLRLAPPYDDELVMMMRPGHPLAKQAALSAADYRAAQHIAPLKIVKASLDFPPMKFYQLWHERTHDAVAAKWLREQISGVVKG